MELLFKIGYDIAKGAMNVFPAIIRAAVASKWIAALTVFCVGYIGMAIFFSFEIFGQDQAAADHQMRRGRLNALAFDKPFLVAIDSASICKKERERSIKKSRSACDRADSDYKAAFPMMDPVFLADRMKDGDYAHRKSELELALQFQREERNANMPESYMERIRPLIQSDGGIYSLVFFMILLPMLATAYRIEKERAKLDKLKVRPRRLLRRRPSL